MQRSFKDVFIAAIVAGTVGVGGSAGVVYSTKEPKVEKTLTRGDLRRHALKWAELEQKQVDAITRIMVSEPKQSVIIFCERDDLCGDMALDLENAFESARWTVKVERPLFNENTGFSVTDERMASHLRKVLGIEVKVIQSSLPANTVGIVLGKRV